MAKVTQKTDYHSTCQESSFKTPNIYTTAFFFWHILGFAFKYAIFG